MTCLNFMKLAFTVVLLGSLFASTVFQSGLFMFGWLIVISCLLSATHNSAGVGELVVLNTILSVASLTFLYFVQGWLSREPGPQGELSKFDLAILVMWLVCLGGSVLWIYANPRTEKKQKTPNQ